MPQPYRSPVPDLLFEDVRDARVCEIGPLLEAPWEVDERTPMHRITVFLTYACNLDCPYCKTIARSPEDLVRFPQKASRMTLAAFERFLDGLEGSPLRHIHFTGGEAALVRTLPEMLSAARDRGAEYLSLTSNGALPVATYLALVDAGIDEIRISIDATDATLGAQMTGRREAWARSVETLRALSERRRGGAGFFLMANTVVTSANRARLDEIVDFLLDLGVDDMKLITVVQEKETLGDARQARASLAKVAVMLTDHPPTAYPLLRRKLQSVFAPESIGLEDIVWAPETGWRCYIPMTERTVDARFYYPCSVYLREGGAPLGPLRDSAADQRRKSAEFVARGDCLDDAICKRYCLHCTKGYNARANSARSL